VAVIGVGAMSAPYGRPILADAAFGTMLFILVASRSYRLVHGCDARTPAEWGEFSRRSCRVVYLMLYGALLLQLSCRMLNIAWSGAGMTLGRSVIACGEGFRGHLLCGVLAQMLIRGLSAYQLRARQIFRTSSPPRPPTPAVRS
jgi:hypothetical protein